MSTKTQGTIVQVGTAVGTAKTITGITAASPPVVTSTAHGLTNGQIVKISGVVGMTQLNGRAFVVKNVAANSFELGGVDATGYTAYASGGSATPQTMTTIGEVVGGSLFDGTATEIDATHLLSTAKEKKMGLQDFGGGTLNLNRISDTGQTKLKSLKASQVSGVFGITAPDGTICAFNAFVMSFTAEFQPDDIWKGQVKLTFENEPSDFV